ncbi:hypothetical protein [Pseudonocardia xishanensis]
MKRDPIYTPPLEIELVVPDAIEIELIVPDPIVVELIARQL